MQGASGAGRIACPGFVPSGLGDGEHTAQGRGRLGPVEGRDPLQQLIHQDPGRDATPLQGEHIGEGQIFVHWSKL